jgi:uncharacterized protein
MRTITKNNLYAYSLGATILGSGGGGDPVILYDMVAYLMEQYGDIKIISADELHEDDLVVPVAFVGAPLVSSERIPNTIVFDKVYEKITQDFPGRNLVLMPAEIGGCNALTPLLLALKYNLPVLDADLIGRAFPRLDMCKPSVLNRSCDPTYLADHMGNVMSLHLNSLQLLESIVRDVTVHFGSCAAISTFLFDGKQVHDYVIKGSISRAMQLGDRLLKHHDLVANVGASFIGTGVVSDVFHDMKGGFLFGYVVIKNENSCFKIYYQNEYLKVVENEIDVAGSPDLIVVIEQKTGLPLTTESLAYGLEVMILTLKAPSFWLDPLSYALVNYKLLELEAK